MRSRISMPDQLALEFKRRIATGIYTPNSFLPPERELSKEFDTSRDTVAAALAVLTREGLAERCRGRGTRILDRRESQVQTAVGIVHAPFDMPWPEDFYVFHGVQEVLSRQGYRFELLGSDDWATIQHGDWPPLTTKQIAERFAGIIYLESLYCDEQILELQSMGFPVVVANLEIELDVTCTWVNHRKTTTHAVRTLAGFGHRRIAYVGREPGVHFYGQAIQGYKIGLEEAQLEFDEALVGTVSETSSLLAYVRAREMLACGDPPTAIVAARDLFAEGVCQAAREAGMVIGRDLSVIGYDDVSWPQQVPFLTTFKEPCFEMGSAAAEMFLEQVFGTSTGVVKREIESEFVIRKSAGPMI